MNGTERRVRAYRAAARIVKERMDRDAPADAEALEGIRASDIVVVRGQYDHVEQVLGVLAMPFTLVEPHVLGRVELRPEQLLVVNCPGQVGRAAVERIREFVTAGGSLFTTDWAIRHVLEPAFPGVVAYNDRPTRDDVVRIEVRNHDNPFLRGVMDAADDPQWWLEGSSYPIRVMDPGRVEVLIRSSELERKYGEQAVAVLIPHGDGEIFHMVSHYYLQRTELRSLRHAMPGVAYAEEKGVAVTPAMAEDLAGVSVGEVESAQASARLFANVAASHARKVRERRARRTAGRNL